ncbi:MAG: Crp/Fnr family transcriptional regulator [Rhizobiaceae bacterium]
MISRTANGAMTSCPNCPLRDNEHFRDFDKEQLAFVMAFKSGELRLDAGATILVEGSHSAHLYTILEGSAFRYKMLEDGRRQILNFVMPGDLIGLQSVLMAEMQHSIEALTPLRLCVFERDRVDEVFRDHPRLAYDVTWIAAREERILDEHLLSVGRRSAFERAAYLIAFLHRRATRSGFIRRKPHLLPVTQQHLADTLGLSVVHTNKTLRKLITRKLIAWRNHGCEVLDADALSDIAGWPDDEDEMPRPFI